MIEQSIPVQPSDPKRLAGKFRFANFNVSTYVVGSAISMIGFFVQSFGQWILVVNLSGNRTALPVTIALQTLPILLLGTWGGSIVDRFDNRRLMALTTMLSTITAVWLGVLADRGEATVLIVNIFAVALGLISVFERPAMQAFLSELAGPSEITRAVGLNATVLPIARLVGPPVGGFLIALSGVPMCFFINAGSYLFFLLALALLRTSEMLPRREPAARKGMVKAGLAYARRDPLIGPVLLGMFVVGFAGFNFPMVLPLMAKYVFHIGEKRLSWTISLSAVGSLVAGVLAARRPLPSLTRLGLWAVAFGVSLCVYGIAPTYWWWFGTSFPVGFTAATYTTTVVQILQKSSRPEMVGRVMALYGIAFFGTTPFGAVFVALLSENVSERAPFILGGILVAVTGFVIMATLGRAENQVKIHNLSEISMIND